MRNRTGLLLIASLLMACSFGCRQEDRAGALKIGGSTLMAHATQAWVDAVRKPPISLNVELGAGGSNAAIQKLLAGELDVAASSRKIEDSELMDAQSRRMKIQETCVGFAVYTVIVHPSNPIEKLTVQQSSDIFSRKIKDWSEIGGPAGPIKAFYRRVRTGEYDHFFERQVKLAGDLPDETDANVVVLDKPSQIASSVTTAPNGIGYLLLPEVPATVKQLKIARTDKDEACAPDPKLALGGNYPLLRPFYIYVNAASPRPVGFFRDFTLSDEGRVVALNAGIVPVPSKHGKVNPDTLYRMMDW